MFWVVYYKKEHDVKYHVAGSFNEDEQKQAQMLLTELTEKGFKAFYKKQWYKPQIN